MISNPIPRAVSGGQNAPRAGGRWAFDSRKIREQLKRRMLPVALVFLALLSGGAYFLIKCPPIWHSYDGLIQIATRPSDMTILQYPAAYPAFSRLHVYVAQRLQAWRTQSKFALDLRKTVKLNDAGIYALIVSQQLALAIALTYFVRSCARGWKASALVIALLLSNAAIFISAQVISSEALAQSLVVLFVALTLRLFLAPRIGAWEYGWYLLILYLLVMTRQVNSVFAGLAPLACLATAMLGRLSLGSWQTGPWRRAALFTIFGVVAIQGANVTTRVLCKIFEVHYRDTGMRRCAEKLGFVNRMPPAERAAFVANLQARCGDPIVREAIPLLARQAGWTDQRGEIEKILRRDHDASNKEAFETLADDYLGRVVREFYRAGGRYLVADTVESIWRMLAQTSPTDVSNYYFSDGISSIKLYASEPWMTKITRELAVCGPEAKDRLAAFQQTLWFRLWSKAPHGVILLVASLGAVWLLIYKIGEPERAIFALTIVVIAMVTTVLTFCLLRFEIRFGAIPNLLGFLAVGIVLASWIESIERRDKKGGLQESNPSGTAAASPLSERSVSMPTAPPTTPCRSQPDGRILSCPPDQPCCKSALPAYLAL